MAAPRTRIRRRLAPVGTAAGYIRCSTEEQAVSGLGIEAQRADIEATAARHGWTITEWFIEEAVSGKVEALDRPVFPGALAAIIERRVERLVVQRVDRIGRDAGDVLNLDRDYPRAFFVAEKNAYTSEDRMRLVIDAGFAEEERRKISERTRAALAAKKARGERLGRPQTLTDDVVLRIITERDGGRTLQAIADGLRADGIATAQGGTWAPSNVRAVLKSQRAADLRTSQA